MDNESVHPFKAINKLNSAIGRFFLIVLGWPLLLLILITSFEWIRDAYFPPALEKPRTDRIQHPGYHSLGLNALQRFSELARPDHNMVIRNLEANLIPMGQWLARLQPSDYDVLFLGEDHSEGTRKFLAEQFFSKFKIDRLLLEATPGELERITKLLEEGKTYIPLLGADIAKVIRAARRKNPHVTLDGIEETKRQWKNRHEDRLGSRDKTITFNFWGKFRPGERYAVLFGALHLTNQPDWFFRSARSLAPPSIANKMLNIRVLGEHQDGPLEAFVFFLDEIGVQKKDFVIPDTRYLHPFVRDWFLLLKQHTLLEFRTLVVFRSQQPPLTQISRN